MKFLRRFSPKVAITDFAGEWRQPTPHRWKILGVAIAITFSGMMLLIPDSTRVPPARPEVTYITTWASDRTQEEIIASNLANQRRKDEWAALAAERAEIRRENFRALGRASFIDVDELERQFREDEAPATGDATSRAAAPADSGGE